MSTAVSSLVQGVEDQRRAMPVSASKARRAESPFQWGGGVNSQAGRPATLTGLPGVSESSRVTRGSS